MYQATQICYECHNNKILSEFYESKRTISGYWSKCKDCHRRGLGATIKRKRLEGEKAIEYKKQRLLEENNETINNYRIENNRLLQEVNFLTAVLAQHTTRLELIERHLSILNTPNEPFGDITDNTVLCYSSDDKTETESEAD